VIDVSLINILNFSVINDNRGSLISLESTTNIPFDIKRVYYLFDTKNDVSRGFHAHKKLKQIAVCVSGSCRFVLDNGKEKETVVLDNPSIGLLIEDMTWREMYDFSKDCVLMVLASELYDEDDYIRSYEEFKKKAVI
jgi:dTDP-4-dehydrorhamnose 3,5-epimerase-like enzyme